MVPEIASQHAFMGNWRKLIKFADTISEGISGSNLLFLEFT